MLVIDASIATKWYLPEKDSEKAKSFASAPIVLVAPSLIISEVLSGITKASRLNNLLADTTKVLCTHWLAHVGNNIVKTIERPEDYHYASTIAVETKHAFQDCLYLALAKRLDFSLLSSDNKQLEIAKQQKIQTIEL